MRGAKKIDNTLTSRRKFALQITSVGEGGGLVEEHPVGNAIAQSAPHPFRVIGKARSGIAIGPTALIFEGLRQIPMVKRDEWPDPGFQQRVHDAAVIIDAFRVHSSGARRLDSRP